MRCISKLWVLLIFVVSCARAPGPALVMNRARLNAVKKFAVLPVTSITRGKDISPLVQQTLATGLTELEKYEFIQADEDITLTPTEARELSEWLEVDAIMNCTVTEYISLESKTVLGGKEKSYDITSFEDTKEEAKKGHGCLWGFIVDLLIPDYRVKGEEEYKYKTVTRSPSIGIELTLMSKEGELIYKGSKFISKQSRIPDCYSATYGGVLAAEQINSVDYIIRLAVMELIEPLK